MLEARAVGLGPKQCTQVLFEVLIDPAQLIIAGDMVSGKTKSRQHGY
jgi:hypothetical protein